MLEKISLDPFHKKTLFNILENSNLSDSQKAQKLKEKIAKSPHLLHVYHKGLRILHDAILKRLPQVTKELINLGADINGLTEDKSYTPLQLAAEKGFEDMILVLGYKGCQIDLQKDPLQQTALHLAVINNHPACVKNLLLASKFKLKKNLLDKNGDTADDLIRKKEDFFMQKQLAEAFNTPEDFFKRTPLHLAVLDEPAKAIDLVCNQLKLGAPINEKGSDGKTALHLAAIIGNKNILLWLCNQPELEIDLQDNEGNTALHYGVKYKHHECVTVLVTAKKPADKSLKNKKDCLPKNLIDYSDNKSYSILTKALNTPPIKQNEKEVFLIREQKDESEFSYKIYLNQHFKALAEPFQPSDEEDHKNLEESPPKIIEQPQKTHRKSTSFFKNESWAYQFEQAYLKNEAAVAAELIKNTQRLDSHFSAIVELKEFLKAHHGKEALRFLFAMLKEYHLLFQTFFHQLLTERGLKPMCQAEEFNPFFAGNFSKEDERTIKVLEIVTEIFTAKALRNIKGEISNDRGIDLNQVLILILGLMDFIEPPLLISYLTKLLPFFSKLQSLQSHYVVYSLIEIYDYYGFDSSQKKQFIEKVENYFNCSNDKELERYVHYYLSVYFDLKNKFFPLILQRSRPHLSQEKDKISEKISSYVEKKSQKDLSYITEEFNIISAIFYRNIELKEYRNKLKDIKKLDSQNESLMGYLTLNDMLVEFIKDSIIHFSEPQAQANAISLYILVARNSLHFKGGSDLTMAMAVVCALSSQIIKDLKVANELVDKEIISMQKELVELLSSDNNYKNYRSFLATDKHILPAITLIHKEKSLIYQSDPLDGIPSLGQIHYSLFLVRKNLAETHWVSHSNLFGFFHLKNMLTNNEFIELEPKINVISKDQTPPPYKSRVNTNSEKEILPEIVPMVDKNSSREDSSNETLQPRSRRPSNGINANSRSKSSSSTSPRTLPLSQHKIINRSPSISPGRVDENNFFSSNSSQSNQEEVTDKSHETVSGPK